MTRRTRRLLAPIALTLLVLAVFVGLRTGPAAGAEDAPVRRLLVLGFDGADADTTERLMDARRLPHLAALRDRGGYRQLATTNPAQSPVAWASMTTGMNAGTTGIYDFLRRVWRKGVAGVSIEIGLVERRKQPLLSPALRVGIVVLAGVLGALGGGLLAWFGLGSFWSSWRRGGWMQAAMTLPAAVLALGAMAMLRWVPAEVPHAHNLRGGEAFWVTLDRAGKRCVALEAPLTFPADEMSHGACLSGLGVPDLPGTWGTFAVWTDDPDVPGKTETAGAGYFVGLGVDAFEMVLPGPADPLPDADAVREASRAASEESRRREISFEWSRPRRRQSETQEALLRLAYRLQTRVAVEIRRGEGATLRFGDGAEVDLVPGTWSDLLPISYELSPLAAVAERARLHGRVRFLLTFEQKLGPKPRFRIFVAPVQFDAAKQPPNVSLSSPREFASELVDAVGPYETLGWPELTNPVKDGLLEDEYFLSHIRVLMESRERRLISQIEKDGWDCLFAMFSETDRVQHALYRHIDPKHPLHDAEAARRFGPEVEGIYEEMDRIVGRAIEAAGPDTDVLVVSDHGFAPFRRGVNLNNLLRRERLQVALPGTSSEARSVADLANGSGYFKDVDWTKTQAYAMGLGNLYLNLAGREASGIVEPDDADAVLGRIEKALLALRDTDGAKVVRAVYRGADLYHGDRTGDAPDLVVGFERGYRVSWQNCLGALDADVITDNMQAWSGDHCSVDPSLVPGILFSSQPLRADAKPKVEDVAASILDALGVTRAGMDGASFLER